jgi:hypothetical protein
MTFGFTFVVYTVRYRAHAELINCRMSAARARSSRRFSPLASSVTRSGQKVIAIATPCSGRLKARRRLAL